MKPGRSETALRGHDRCHRLPVSAEKLLITVLVVLVTIFVITVGIGG